MKRTFLWGLKLFVTGILFFIIPFIATAQKLPNIQANSLNAPSNIKVDGKPTEWNDQFQAYNKTVGIFYTLTNDKDKLYLVVKATNLDIVNKIICGGVTLTINAPNKVKGDEGVGITFPAIEVDRRVVGPRGYPPINLEKPEGSEVVFFMDSVNQQIASKAKDIRVTGIKAIPDHLISIYNTQGIKAAVLVDEKIAMTYELAVPLKYLGLSSETKSFAYTIQLTGMDANINSIDSQMQAFQTLRWPIKKTIKITMVGNLPQFEPYVQNLLSPTNLSGEYALNDK
jgi:hypothetical protein